MDDQQRREALYEAVREALPAEDPAVRPVPPPRNRRAVLALALGWGFLGYIWIARPSWIFGPATDSVLSADRREAALRFTLYLERGRVEGFVEDHGTLPGSLAEAGPVDEGVDWRPDGSGYVLTGELQGQTLRLSSAMDADSFLGRSLDVLRR